MPFYVYAYTFGQLLVLSLYQQYKAEGEAFKPRYLKILAAGGSKAPVEILADGGHRHLLRGVLAGRLRCDPAHWSSSSRSCR